MENITYILNPDYGLKNDRKRVILYAKNVYFIHGTSSWFSIIHPLHAMILSFFTKERTYKENIALLEFFLEKNKAEIEQFIVPFINNEENLFVLFGEKRIWFPKNLLIPADQIKEEQCTEQYEVEDFICENIDLEGERPIIAPHFFTLMLNNTCVTNCNYCYADKLSKYKPLSTGDYLDIIREAKKLKVKNINIIGGEVFLHKDWAVILKELVLNGFSPDIISTKMPLTKPILNKIKEIGYKNPIQISLDAVNSSILEKMLNVKANYLESVKKGIQLIDSMDIPYQINTIITNANDKIEIMIELFDYLCSLKNIGDWRISPAMNSLYINHQDFNLIKSSKERIADLFKYIENEIIPSSSFGIILGNVTLEKISQKGENGAASFMGGICSGLYSQMFILPDGNVTICEQFYWNTRYVVGNLKHETIEEVWNSERMKFFLNIEQENLRNETACKTCDLFNSCYERRCWVDVVKAYGDKNWDYPDPRCIKSKKMKYDISYK